MHHHFTQLDRDMIVDYNELIRNVNHMTVKLFIELYINSCSNVKRIIINNIMEHLLKLNEPSNKYFLYFIFRQSIYGDTLKLPYSAKWKSQTPKYMYNYIHYKTLLNKSIKQIHESDRLELLDMFSKNNDFCNFKMFFSYKTKSNEYINTFRKHYNMPAVEFLLIYSQTVTKNIYNAYLSKFHLVNYNILTPNEIHEIMTIIALYASWYFEYFVMLYEKYKIMDVEYFCDIFDKKQTWNGIKYMIDNFNVKKNTFINSFNYCLGECKNRKGLSGFYTGCINYVLPNIDFNVLPQTTTEELVKIYISDIGQLKIIIDSTNIKAINVINIVADYGTFNIVKQLYNKYTTIDIDHIVDSVIRQPVYQNIRWLIENFVFDKNKFSECIYMSPCMNDINIIKLLDKHLVIDHDKLSGVTTNIDVHTYLSQYNVNTFSYELYLNCAKTNNFEKFVDLYKRKPIDLSDNEIIALFAGHKNFDAVRWICIQ